MPPPFVLENIHTNPMELRPKVTLYTKKKFIPSVKVEGWDNYQSSQPYDRNPYCPDKYNLFSSHYDHLGGDDVKWSTTTGDMSKQVLSRRKDLEINPNKNLVNVYTAIEYDVPVIKPSYNYDHCYISTMQSSYSPPYPYPMKRLTLTDPPFLQNRKFSHIPRCKFLDDTYLKDTRDLQTHKMFRQVSYNCTTNKFTDGSPGYTRENNKCYDLKFYQTENDASNRKLESNEMQ